MNQVGLLGGVDVFVLAESGPALASTQDFLEVIGALWGEAPEVRQVAIPTGRLAGEFFDLRSGLAGDALQKFVNYRLQVAVVGDVAAHRRSSQAFDDFVRESNDGSHVWFVADLDELAARLSP